MKRIICLDTETSGVDPAKDSVLEVAVVLYDIPHSAVVATFASLLYTETNEAEHMNEIPLSLLDKHRTPEMIWQHVEELAEEADLIIAHNAEFDRSFCPKKLQAMKWVCSMSDIVWPKGKPGGTMAATALAHGVPVFSAHRALPDVDTMVRTFQAVSRAGGDVAQMLRDAMKPKSRIIALVSYEEKDKAKAAGFKWNGVAKLWERNMRSEEAAKLPFKYRISS